MADFVLKIVKQKPRCECCGEAPLPDLLALKVDDVDALVDRKEIVIALTFDRALAFHAALEKVINPHIQTTGSELDG